jgi:hypothetical protein
MNVLLWILQVLLAMAFFAHGWLLLAPPAEMLQQMATVMPDWFRLFLGVAEVLAAIGLTLPGITRIQPQLLAWSPDEQELPIPDAVSDLRTLARIFAAVLTGPIHDALLTAAERIQYEGYLRREDTNAAILRQAETGVSIKEIVRLTPKPSLHLKGAVPFRLNSVTQLLPEACFAVFAVSQAVADNFRGALWSWRKRNCSSCGINP